jgi:hypothetical protein
MRCQPGDYLAVAVDDAEAFAVEDPAFVQRLSARPTRGAELRTVERRALSRPWTSRLKKKEADNSNDDSGVKRSNDARTTGGGI